MADYTVPEYSKRKVVKAGRVLTQTGLPHDEDVATAFRIAHNWRNAHALPMHRIRQELLYRARRVQDHAITASRLKRMTSIRRKLRSSPETLYQLQYLGGCRAILNTMEEVRRLVAMYQNGESKHTLNRHWDYISAPKSDGYRGHHLAMKFVGRQQESAFNRRSVVIEVQVRSRLQHAWATAVEAVGLARAENLKGGEGSADWLRLFQIMSAEFAVEESCPLPPDVAADENIRRTELIDLAESISAIKSLENYNQAISYAERYYGSATLFLVQYDHANQNVTVRPYYNYSTGQDEYIVQESDFEDRTTVLVEVDKVDDLREAFPNYFLDVRLFNQRLRSIVYGLDPESRTRDAAPQSTKHHDLSWLGSWQNRRR